MALEEILSVQKDFAQRGFRTEQMKGRNIFLLNELQIKCRKSILLVIEILVILCFALEFRLLFLFTHGELVMILVCPPRI